MFSLGFTVADVRRILWTALQTFVAVFVAGLNDVLNGFQGAGLSGAKAAGVALIAAALAAVLSVVKNGLLADGSSLK